MTSWMCFLSVLLILTVEASMQRETVDVDELLSLNHAFNSSLKLSMMRVTANQLKIEESLGEGAYGEISVARVKAKNSKLRNILWGEVFALKKIPLWQKKVAVKPSILREKTALESIHHPFIIQLRASFEDTKNAFFLLELGCSPDIFEILCSRQRFDKKTSQFYVASLMLAIEYLHSRGIIHRDVKLENAVLDKSGFLKLIDFGSSKRSSDMSLSMAGTRRYISPEMLLNQPHGKAVDWWAVGHAMFEMLAGHHVFEEEHEILRGDIDFPAYFEEDAIDLIKLLLEPLQSKRLGVRSDSWKIITEHPWFTGFDWIGLLKKQVTVPIDVISVKGRCRPV